MEEGKKDSVILGISTLGLNRKTSVISSRHFAHYASDDYMCLKRNQQPDIRYLQMCICCVVAQRFAFPEKQQQQKSPGDLRAELH